MELYTYLRQFADSWGLLYMMAVFLVVVIYTFRPGSKKFYEEQAQIPLQEESKTNG